MIPAIAVIVGLLIALLPQANQAKPATKTAKYAAVAATHDAPVVLEDWACGRAESITNTSPAVVACNAPHGLRPTTVAGQPWMFHLSGGTGAWEKINGRYGAEIVDDRHFRIKFDATELGAFSGQQVAIIRGNHDWQELTRSGLAGLHGVGVPTAEGLFEINVPAGYSATNNSLYCAGTPITGFEVAGGVATVSLARAPTVYKPVPDREIHFRDLNEPRLNSTLYQGPRGQDRPHRIATVSDDKKQLTVPVQVPDGAYTAVEGKTAAVFLCSPNAWTFLFHSRDATGYPAVSGRVGNYAKNGPIASDVNRLEVWIRWDFTTARKANGSWGGTLGAYAKAGDDPELKSERYHFYHHFNPNFYTGRWIKFIFNDTVQHVRSATGSAQVPGNPLRKGWPYYSAPLWDGRADNYLPQLTYFYIDMSAKSAEFEPIQSWMSPITMYAVKNEPDAYISNITALWAPDRVDKRGQGYEVGFNVPKASADSYEIRYSTEGSLKTQGFSSGKSGGTVNGLFSAYTNVMWYSPAMPEAPSMWVGLRPQMAVWGTSGNGVSPVVVTTRNEAGLEDGDTVTITGVSGNTAANVKNAAITNLPAPMWMLDSGLVQIEVAKEVGTVTLDRPHNLVAGQVVEVYGSTNPFLGRFPGSLLTVQSVASATTFTVAAPKSPDGIFNSNVTPPERLAVRVLPSFSVDGRGNGNFGAKPCHGMKLCTISGKATATGDRTNFTEVVVQPFEAQFPGRVVKSAAKTGK